MRSFDTLLLIFKSVEDNLMRILENLNTSNPFAEFISVK